jgi:hypothetical protein
MTTVSRFGTCIGSASAFAERVLFGGMSFLPEHLQLFIREGTAWVSAGHAAFGRLGRPLISPIQGLLATFIPPETLARIRVVLVPQIENPPFYTDLAAQGFAMPLDFREMAGITFVDTILVSQGKADLSDTGFLSLVFHEAVHVVQFQHLGVEKFMREYVTGWARAGFSYPNISLELQAYALQARFKAEPSIAFSVLEEVQLAFP